MRGRKFLSATSQPAAAPFGVSLDKVPPSTSVALEPWGVHGADMGQVQVPRAAVR